MRFQGLFTPEIASLICEGIAGGKSLRKVCEPKDMPSPALVCKWLADEGNAAFREQYARAREAQADVFFDEVVDIADTEADTNKARVRIDARKWAAGKLRPKKYGEKLTLDGDGNGGAISLVVTTGVPRDVG